MRLTISENGKENEDRQEQAPAPLRCPPSPPSPPPTYLPGSQRNWPRDPSPPSSKEIGNDRRPSPCQRQGGTSGWYSEACPHSRWWKGWREGGREGGVGENVKVKEGPTGAVLRRGLEGGREEGREGVMKKRSRKAGSEGRREGGREGGSIAQHTCRRWGR